VTKSYVLAVIKENMSDKIMFIPHKEEFIPQGLIIYLTKFNLGFFEIRLRLLRSELAGLTVEGKAFLKSKNESLAKNFINIITIGQLGWIWFASDSYEEAEQNYKSVIKKLKLGYDAEFTDVGGQNKPIKVSWRGIQFNW